MLLFYAKGKPVPTIFATQNENLHRSLRKPISTMYGMSKVVHFEPQVDSTMRYFFKRLDDLFADGEQACNLAFWLQAFAFDVVGEITFSKRIGFLEKGEDVDGIMGSIWNYFRAASPVSLLSQQQKPRLSFYLAASTLGMHRISPDTGVRNRQHPPRLLTNQFFL